MTDYTLSASAGSYAETGDDVGFLARSLGAEARVFNVTGFSAGSSTSLFAQAYPALDQAQGTKRTMRTGTLMRYPTNGDVRARRGAPFAARDPTLVHKNLSLEQWQELRGFEATVRGRDSFPVFYVAEAATVSCVFAQNAFDARIAANTRPVRFNVTAFLTQVLPDSPPTEGLFFLDRLNGPTTSLDLHAPDIGAWSDQHINFADGVWDNSIHPEPTYSTTPWPLSDLLLDGIGRLYVPNAATGRHYIGKLTSAPNPAYAIGLTLVSDFSKLWSGEMLIAMRASSDPTITPDGGNCVGLQLIGVGDGTFLIGQFISDTGGSAIGGIWTSPTYPAGTRTVQLRFEVRGLTVYGYVDFVQVFTFDFTDPNGTLTGALDNYFGWYDVSGSTPGAPVPIDLTAMVSSGLPCPPSMTTLPDTYLPVSIEFKPDGTKIFVCAGLSGVQRFMVHEYALSTPWDVGTATHTTSLDVPTDITEGSSLKGAACARFNGDGTKLTAVRWTNDAYVYTLGTAYDLTSAGSPSTFSVSLLYTWPFRFNAAGDRAYRVYVDSLPNAVKQFSLSSAFDYSTASLIAGTLAWSTSPATSPVDITFNSDGSKLYLLGKTSGSALYVFEYDLGTPWDVSTGTLTNTRLLDESPVGSIAIGAADTKLYDGFYAGTSDCGVVQYSVPSFTYNPIMFVDQLYGQVLT